ALRREPAETHDAVSAAALVLLAAHAEELEELSDGSLWRFLSECRVAYLSRLLADSPGPSARRLLARHLLSQPSLVGAGWGDGPTAINTYLAETGDLALAAELLALGGRLPESVAR